MGQTGTGLKSSVEWPLYGTEFVKLKFRTHYGPARQAIEPKDHNGSRAA